ncbi:MAG TPA: LCP family protein [Ktedonobacteraceae bacterium]|nr:LCP family protein [Ktedonobacteraceae bacterium]
MDNDTTSRDISRDTQTRQGRLTRPEVHAPYQSKSSTSQFLLPSKRRKLYHFKKKKREWEPVTIACTAFLLLIMVACGVFSTGYYYYMTNIQPSLTSFVRPVSRDHTEPVLSQPVDTSIITGRSWNILLLGSDNDGKFTFPEILTQVMMVVHIDTVNNTVSMVSIPRDSWVAVPEVGGMHKIDQAFLLGSQRDKSFEGGVRLARLTIEQDYGITIDRYAWVGLDGFAKVIDILGGVDVDITHPVVDDTYPDDSGAGSDPSNPYAYARLYLVPGPQHLSGAQALQYVRTRHSDQIGDIGRTERQQEVLEALKPKLTSSDVVGSVTQLLKSLDKKFYTDLSEQEMLAMADYGRTVSSNTLQHITLGPGQDKQDYGDLATLYDPSLGMDQSVIIPHCENIQPVINHIFQLGDMQSCNVTASY